MVSHIGSNDPNMGWLTLSLKTFEKKYPNVTTEYISTNQYSVQEHVRLLEQAISTQPDGIAVPIVSSDAFEGPLRQGDRGWHSRSWRSISQTAGRKASAFPT